MMRSFDKTDQPVEFVQIYGERNSGTNHLARLLQDNMRQPDRLLGLKESEATPLGTRIFGYKHWFVDPAKFTDSRQPRTLFVVIWRNPYTWLRAMMARPYALERSIGGRSVAELPDIRLAGHVNGKDTRTEFHPVTGEAVTLFELRRLKIESFGMLETLADHVIFLNLETLLDSPLGLLRHLGTRHAAAFRPDPVLRDPPPALRRECSRPEPFSDAETAILDRNIHWPSEARIGYGRGSYTVCGVQS